MAKDNRREAEALEWADGTLDYATMRHSTNPPTALSPSLSHSTNRDAAKQ
jgi:hypothetical protein